MPTFPFRLSESPTPQLRWVPGRPGEHNQEVFGSMLGYSSEELDTLSKQADVLPVDDPERAQLYLDAQKVLVKDAPVAFLYHDAGPFLVKPWVKGLHSTPLDYFPGIFDISSIEIVTELLPAWTCADRCGSLHPGRAGFLRYGRRSARGWRLGPTARERSTTRWCSAHRGAAVGDSPARSSGQEPPLTLTEATGTCRSCRPRSG